MIIRKRCSDLFGIDTTNLESDCPCPTRKSRDRITAVQVFGRLSVQRQAKSVFLSQFQHRCAGFRVIRCTAVIRSKRHK